MCLLMTKGSVCNERKEVNRLPRKNIIFYNEKKGVIDMMILTALGYAMVFILLAMVTVFISAKIESKITFKEIIDGFKRR